MTRVAGRVKEGPMGHYMKGWWALTGFLGLLFVGCDSNVALSTPEAEVLVAAPSDPVQKPPVDDSRQAEPVESAEGADEQDGAEERGRCYDEPYWKVIHVRGAIDADGEVTVGYNVVRNAQCSYPPLPLDRPHHFRVTRPRQMAAEPVELRPRDSDYQKSWLTGRSEALESGRTAVSLTAEGRAYATMLLTPGSFYTIFDKVGGHRLERHAPPNGGFSSVDPVLGPEGGVNVAMGSLYRACVRLSTINPARAGYESWVRDDCGRTGKFEEVRHAFLGDGSGDFVTMERDGSHVIMALYGESHEPIVFRRAENASRISVIPWGERGAFFALTVTDRTNGDERVEARIYRLTYDADDQPSIELYSSKPGAISRGLAVYRAAGDPVPVLLLMSYGGHSLAALHLTDGGAENTLDYLQVDDVFGRTTPAEHILNLLESSGDRCRLASPSLAKSAVDGVGAVVFGTVCANRDADRVYVQRFGIQ